TKEYLLENFKKVIFNSGVYHDIGKIDDNFQNYLLSKTKKSNNLEYDVQIENDKKIDLDSYPLHQELSWAFLTLLNTSFKQKSINFHNDLFLYSVYWHHAKLLRNNSVNLGTNQDILNSEQFNLEN